MAGMVWTTDGNGEHVLLDGINIYFAGQEYIGVAGIEFVVVGVIFFIGVGVDVPDAG